MHDRCLEADATETPGGGRDAEGDQWFRFILLDEIAIWEARGWKVVSDLHGTPHARWSVLMQWMGEGEPAGKEDGR